MLRKFRHLPLGCAFAFAIGIFPSSPASAGHNSYDPWNPPDGTEFNGFFCTTANGTVVQSNLPADCAEWYPGCARKPDPPPPGKKCPNSCKRAYFKVRRIPVAYSDEYIHHHSYSTYTGGSGNYGPGNSSTNSANINTGNGPRNKSGNDTGGAAVDNASGAEGNGPQQAAGGSFGAAGGGGGTHSQATSRGDSSAGLGGPKAGGGRGPSAATGKPGAAAGTSDAPKAGALAGRRANGARESGGDPGLDGPLTLEAAMAMADRARAGKLGKQDYSEDAAASSVDSAKNKGNYTDPWLDYMATSSRAELVAKLERDSKFREDVRKRIDEMNDSSGASDPEKREKLEYYRKALAEAEARVRQGGLQALKPLEKFEEFSMNSDDTDHEIKRLLASMDDKAADLEERDDGLHYPLFSRVHRSLWRQLANGNIVLKTRKR